ncbi:MAG: DUF1549 domain-containing protein [Bryobacteraceae bacterium]
MSLRLSGRILFTACALVLAANAWVDKDDVWVASKKNWWAFQPVKRPAVPEISDPRVNTPVDSFLLEALRAKSIEPNPQLGKEALIRRVTLDLTGLPPTPAEVARFVADRSPRAWETLVDRLMQSPHYGERWATKWLDVVRYSDTNGYESDAERPHAWRYRDYVVAAFNNDKPFDRFIQEQIAGDELFPGDREALIATGFHRCGPIHLVGGMQDEEMNRQEVLTEVTNAIGTTFLGLSVGCARCHNHKFDPIPQADYYRLQAVFAATEFKDVPLASDAEKKQFEEAKKAHEEKLKPIKDEIAAIEKPYRERIQAEKKARLEPEYAAALAVPKDQRNEEQKRMAKEAETQIKVSWDDVVAVLSQPDRERRAGLRRQMHRLDYDAPQPLIAAFGVSNMDVKEAPATHVLKVGNHKMKLDRVGPGLLRVMSPEPVGESVAGRRSALARWLSSPEHPLTARVMVNRIWQLRMGKGLVPTPNDYGVLGSRAANPKLLDWLAAEFVASGWSVKKLDRLILLSSAYRQTTDFDEAKAKADPDNKLFWRAERRRLEAEFLRDSVLAVSGALNPRMGGRGVRAPIEPEIYDLIFTEGEPDNLWPVALDKSEHNRRTMYLLNKRTVRLPMLANFDQPDNMTSCPVRPTSTHALQALSMLNSDLMHEQSARFASRLEGECGKGRDCQVRLAYELALARKPKPVEQEMAREFFAKGGPLADFCLALMNRHEFAYLP